MRKFKISLSDEEVDLDDPKTYEYLPNDCRKLDDLMFCEIGKVLVYINNFHPEWKTIAKNQIKRINSLIKDFADVNAGKNILNRFLMGQYGVHYKEQKDVQFCATLV
jgi:hypothetical protein